MCRGSVIPETLGQFTGYTLVDGSKIFENDIIKITLHTGKEFYYLIWFDREVCETIAINIDNIKFDKTLFKWIENYKEIKDNKRKVVLFHYPIAVWNASHHGSYHLYGHIHRNIETPHPLDFNLGEYALNVGMDVNNFVPMSLDELIQKYID